MTEFSYTISDPNGIHARPAGLFVQRIQGFKSIVTVIKDDHAADGTKVSTDGKKLIALMKLRIKCGQTIIVRAEGEDELVAIEAAREFLMANL
ncbi:MAG: HPr family phosphocarrier protein [Treponema sp.]|nr:HPr family phosphocarrier protein [Treponema sp.]